VALVASETQYDIITSSELQRILACPSMHDPERVPHFDFHAGTTDLYGKLEGVDSQRKFHYVHTYPGRVHPWIPMYLLGMEKIAQVEGPVVDPFSGTGTIALEALINLIHPRSAVAMEINPLASLITRVKTCPARWENLDQIVAGTKRRFASENASDGPIENSSLVRFWYSARAIERLSRLKSAIEGAADIDNSTRDFLNLAFYSVCRGSSRADPRIPPPVVLKERNYSRSERSLKRVQAQLARVEDPPVLAMFESAVKINDDRLRSLSAYKPFWNGQVDATVLDGDCTSLLRSPRETRKSTLSNIRKTGKVSLFITSPPYLTAQKYIRSSKLQLAWMGYSEDRIRALDRGSIGTESSGPRADWIIPFLPLSVLTLIAQVSAQSEERARSVQSYFAGMTNFLSAMCDRLADDGVAVLITGDNSVCGEPVPTHTLLADCAESVGLRPILTVANDIKNYSMMTCRNRTGGVIRTEYVTWFTKA